MIKKIALLAVGSFLPLIVSAQGATDGYALSQSDMRGTARFMSMGGAFSALGADLSAITYNPGGIGVYRGSEIGATFDLSVFHSETNAPGLKNTRDNVIPYLNSVGYVGSFNLNNSTFKNFNIGLSFNKVASFSRRYRGNEIPIGTSMTNYIAGVANANGVTEGSVKADPDYNPYDPIGYTPAPWLTVLGYESKLITPNNVSDDETIWTGMWADGTRGTALMEATETGGVDQYDITLGGNISDFLFWGMDFGITDLNYKKTSLYGENLYNAYTQGEFSDRAYWDMYNYYRVNGTGFNYKLGFIVKPIQELRIGFAFHTPTYYSLNEYYYANTMYDMSALNPQIGGAQTNNGYTAYNDYNYRTPWKINVGLAGVLFDRLILSADYNWEETTGIKYIDTWGYNNFYYTNHDIKNYYRNTQQVRVGAEFRVTPLFSVRAGYSYVSSPVKSKVMEGEEPVYTSGTRPEYTLDNSTNYITAGLGYKYKSFYIDGAYVYKHSSSQWQGFTSTALTQGRRLPKANIDFDTHQVLISAGMRF